MLTSLEFLKVGQPWPPPGEEKRLEKYIDLQYYTFYSVIITRKSKMKIS